MPSLKPSVGGASALLRSAASAQNIVQEIQDKAAADAYAESAYTDDAYATYSDYLTTRQNSLLSTGSAANVLKAMSVADTLRSATHLNTSAAIARENIAIMTGQATLQDKANVISGEFVRAQANGDSTLAQSLMSQYYSVSQEIQYQQQTAASASTALATANGKALAKSQGEVADNLLDSLKQFNKDFATVGQKSANATINKYLNTASDELNGKTPLQTLTDLGVNLPSGAAPNYFDIVEGVGKGVYNAYALAGKSVDPYLGAGDTNSYFDKANNIVTGVTKLPINGGNASIADLPTLANALSQGAIAYNETTGGFGKAAIPGVPQGSSFQSFKYDVTTHSVQPVITNNAFVASDPTLTAETAALGLKHSADNKGQVTPGATVQVTNQSPDWLRKVVPVGSLLNVGLNNNGQLNFSATTTTGQPGNAVYTIVKDATGKMAPVESGPTGDIILGGQYGFNANNIKTTNGSGFMGGNSNGSGLHGSPHMSLTSDFSSVNTLINQAQQKAAAVSAATLAAAKALLPTTLPPLPNIVQPSPAPQANISIAPRGVTTALQSLPVTVQNAANIAPKTANPQKAAGGLQGGSVNLNGGGSIRI